MLHHNIKVRLAMGVIALAVLGAGAVADVIRLASGETLTVTILETTETTIRFSHPILGELTLPREQVEIIPPPRSETPAEPAPAEPAAPEPPPPPAAPTSFWDGWSRSVDLGLNGSEGNSEAVNGRVAVATERMTDLMESSASISFAYAADSGEKSRSRAEALARNDWLFADSPWGFFVQSRGEFDEFQDWRWRLAGQAGPSYAFIKDEETTLRGRIGAGVVKEFGSGRNELIPEGLLGADFSHQVTERQKVFATVDLLPSLADLNEFRIDAKAGYEILVDPEVNMFLKLGIADRYNTDPGSGRKRNDVEYFVTLGWEF